MTTPLFKTFDAALQVYKIRSDIFYTAAEELLAARKEEQEQSSFVDLTEVDPDVIEINDEGVDSDGGGKKTPDVQPNYPNYGSNLVFKLSTIE